jgi:two-component system, cell cycle sensor histidine kinase and response regulator CckA
MKILLVDDDRVFLKYLTRQLETAGYEVVTAADGITALNLLTEITPDVIFLDLILPKIDGDKLCRVIRKMDHLNDCRLVVISAVVAEMGSNFDDIGADSYIAKGPFATVAEHVLAVLKASTAPKGRDKSKKILGLEHVSPRQLTRELLSRNQHLKTILESMEEGILEIVEGVVVYANKAAVRLFGLPLEKILAANPTHLFDVKERFRVADMLSEVDAQVVEIGENHPIEQAGRKVTVRSFRVDSDSNGRIILISDITDRKRLEVQLQHAQKMEAIGTIASGVAHNFRNSLTGILVNSQVIQENYPNNPELMEIAGRINTSVKKGAQLIERLMQFSRKQIEREFHKIDLVTVIAGIYQIIRKSFNDNIDIRLHLKHSLPVVGDETGLSLVLMNLSSNARDAMPNGGTLEIDALRDGSTAVVKICDSGEGMDEETCKKCFDPFFTTKDVGRGTGLGLSTSYGIIKGHDGEISVESSPQKGTTFLLRLPLAERAEKRDRDGHHDILRGDGQTILVFEESAKDDTSLRDVLECIGYRPVLTSDEDDLLNHYKNIRPQAILLDMNFPAENGTPYVDKILSLDPAANIAILTDSAADETALSGKAFNGRIKGYLGKPVDVAELSRLLASMLN